MAIPEGAGAVPVHAVPVTPVTPRARDIAAWKGTRITMMGNATSVQRGITNMTRVPATAARQVTRITMMASVIRSHPVLRP